MVSCSPEPRGLLSPTEATLSEKPYSTSADQADRDSSVVSVNLPSLPCPEGLSVQGLKTEGKPFSRSESRLNGQDPIRGSHSTGRTDKGRFHADSQESLPHNEASPDLRAHISLNGTSLAPSGELTSRKVTQWTAASRTSAKAPSIQDRSL